MKRLALFVALLVSAATASADLEQLRNAAQAGNVEAQLELGELYEFGFTMPQNAVPAYAWYSIAADRGNAKAAQRRDLLKSKMSSAELAEGERQRAALSPTISTSPAPLAAPEDKPPQPKVAPASPPAGNDTVGPIPPVLPDAPAPQQ